jgi:RNA polymerase sigma-70 factor (ECF subfamily)
MTEDEFIQAFQLYNPTIYSFIKFRVNSKDIAQDLTQEIFIKLWDKRTSFDKRKSSLKTFLFTIAKNHLIDYYRSSKKYYEELKEDATDIESNNERDIDLEYIKSKIKQLDSDEQILISLKYIEELSNDEISVIINKNINSTKVSISRALQKLKELINRDYTNNELPNR